MESQGDKYFVTSAIMIDEQRGTADLYASISDRLYPVEGTKAVQSWPVSVQWSSSRVDEGWSDWKFVSARIYIRPQNLEDTEAIAGQMKFVTQNLSKDIAPVDFIERLCANGDHVEIINDPRLGEYVVPSQLQYPEWNLWAAWHHVPDGEYVIASCLAPTTEDARTTIMDYLKEEDKDSIGLWAESNFAIRLADERTHRPSGWYKTLAEKAALIAIAEK